MNKDIAYLNNILEIEKNISNYYSSFLNETSNDYLYENIFSMLEDSKDMAREIYNIIYDKNRFLLDEVEDNRISLLVKKLENLLEN